MVKSRPSSWRLAGISLISGLSLMAMALVPFAASPASAQKAHKSSSYGCHSKAKVKQTGSVRYSDWQFPDTLNYYQTGASVSIETIDALYESIATWNSKGQAIPDLISSAPVSKDGGHSFRATLRSGMKWSNGKTITAQDVVFGWKMEMDPKSGPWCASTCDAISSITVKGKYGLTFHLRHIYAPFFNNALTNIYAWPTSWTGTNGVKGWKKGDLAAAVNELFQDQSFNFEGPGYPTNGPYTVSSFVANDRIVLKPMKYYHIMSCGARLSQLLFVYYSSKAGLIAAAAQKATDTTTNYTIADAKLLFSHRTYKTYIVPSYDFEHLLMNVDPTLHGTSTPNPLHNPKVRLALALGLDKLGVLRSALGISKSAAQAVIGWSPLIITKGFVQPYGDPKLKGQWDPLMNKGKGGYTVNTGVGTALKDAKKLLGQTPYKKGFTVQGITTTGNPVRAAEFSAIQKSWKNIGVNFVPNFTPASHLFADFAHGAPGHTGDFQIEMYTSTGSSDPDTLTTTVSSRFIDREKTVHTSINANDSGIKDARIDRDMSRGATTLNTKLRAKYYKDFQSRMNQQAYWIILYYRNAIATEDGKIGNFSTNPTGVGEEWNTWQWFAKK